MEVDKLLYWRTKVLSEIILEKDLFRSFKRMISGSTRERKMFWMSSCGRRQRPMAFFVVEFRWSSM